MITLACNAFDPFVLFRIADSSPAHTRQNVTESEQEERETKWLLCAFCREKITLDSNAISIDGRHIHTFCNPRNFTFVIGCFQQAPGCVTVTSPTLEATWFSGYAWQIAVCGSCETHLGWKYSMEQSFYGLIKERLIHET